MDCHRRFGLSAGTEFLEFGRVWFAGKLGCLRLGQGHGAVGLGQFSNSAYGMIGFGALSGGIGAELSGGNSGRGQSQVE